MSIAQEKLEQIRAQVQLHLDGRQSTELTAARKAELESTIRGNLKAHNAVIVAHYYTAPEIQALAEATGGCVSDSLEMARFGRDHPAETLIVAGVRFMGETAKILTPGKRVLMPTLEATCSLDEGCPIDEFSAFCDAGRKSKRGVFVFFKGNRGASTSTSSSSSSPRSPNATPTTPNATKGEVGKKKPLKLLSWNVNGLRSTITNRPSFLADLENATNGFDVLALQETKLQESHAMKLKTDAEEWTKNAQFEEVVFSCSKARKGYSGVALILANPRMKVLKTRIRRILKMRIISKISKMKEVTIMMKQNRISKIKGKLMEKIQMRSCLLYTSPSPRDLSTSRMPSSA